MIVGSWKLRSDGFLSRVRGPTDHIGALLSTPTLAMPESERGAGSLRRPAFCNVRGKDQPRGCGTTRR